MDRWLITFFIGAILSLFTPIVPELFYVNLFTLVASVFLLSRKLRFLSGLFFGAAWIIFSGFQYNNIWQKNNLDTSTFFDKAHVVIGKVNVIPSQTLFKQFTQTGNDEPSVDKQSVQQFNYKFNFIVSKIDQQVLSAPIKIRLNWNKVHQNIYQGSELTLQVKLKPPHGLSNQGGFNYKVWLRQNNIVATGYVINNKNNQIVQKLKTHRQQLYTNSLKLLPEHQLSSLLTALSFGERAAIQQATWNILNVTNTQHLIAISGLHLGLIATGSFLMISFLLRLLPLRYFLEKYSATHFTHFLLSKNSKLIAVILSCSLTFYYAYLAGFSLPTVRALIMLLLFWSFRLMEIKCSLITWLLLTVFIVLILTPMSLISGSFWLSFYAVSLILLTVWRFQYSFAGRNKLVIWFKSLFWVQLSLSIFMLPIVILFNYQLSFVSILANLIAVPLMSFTSIPLCLLAVLIMPFSESLASFFYQIALMSINLLWDWLTLLANQPWALMSISFSHIIIISLAISLIGLTCFLSLNKRYVIPLCFLFGLWFTSNLAFNKKNNQWELTVLDVGQGLSIVIEKNNKAILYDTGASYPSGFNMVEASVLPYLKHKGIRQLDKVIISHSDNDHAGGLTVLKEAISINEVIANDTFLKGDKGCKQGDKFIWQGLIFNVLWPIDEPKYSGDENDDSCVITVSDGQNRILLPGDISKRIEKLLIEDQNILPSLQSDVIIAPHHGSKTSSTEAFIHSVSPKYVVYSTGFMNRWKMPSNLVEQRYTQKNVIALNTAVEGMINIQMQPDKGFNKRDYQEPMLTVRTYNNEMYPFWFAR